ncbi:MAG TPA: UTP--glucose-1-phosphate uridylyltransferase GalU [Acidimicrobiia bacterium]
MVAGPAASRRVTKAVIPAAGLGTRFLPVTKAVPKEMLPVVDRPSIQYVVEEAVAAGLTDILVITSRGKGPIEDHFDRAPELEALLEQDGKLDLLAEVRAPTEMADVHYVRQGATLGLGHAIGVARDHVGDESFVVLLGDDIMIDDAALLCRMLEVHEREGGTVLALLEVPPDQISSYGSVAVEEVGDDVLRVHDLVEKPPADEAPSNLAVIGRYVFPPSIFDAIDRTSPGVNDEIQITDAIGVLLEKEPVHGVRFTEGRYDIGQKLDFLRANIEVALARDDLGPGLAALLRDIVDRHGLT